MRMDFSLYYDLEYRLFPQIRDKYLVDGTISSIDFYSILIWKAERAKTKHFRRLKNDYGYSSFDHAVSDMMLRIFRENESGGKLKILMDDFGFKIPTGSAILSVLYPDTYAVYDRRVREEVGFKYDLSAYMKFSDEVWLKYKKFVSMVKLAMPGETDLREIDRYLWGRSRYRQIESDLRGV